MTEGKGLVEVPAPAVLQVPVPDEATASGSEAAAEASGLQDVALSDSEEVTLFERDLKSSHQDNPDGVSLEKQIAAQQSSQGEKKYLSSMFLQLETGLRWSSLPAEINVQMKSMMRRNICPPIDV